MITLRSPLIVIVFIGWDNRLAVAVNQEYEIVHQAPSKKWLLLDLSVRKQAPPRCLVDFVFAGVSVLWVVEKANELNGQRRDHRARERERERRGSRRFGCSLFGLRFFALRCVVFFLFYHLSCVFDVYIDKRLLVTRASFLVVTGIFLHVAIWLVP